MVSQLQSKKLTEEYLNQLQSELDLLDAELIELENRTIAVQSRREAIRLVLMSELQKHFK